MITGKVFDLSTKKPIEYANVILFSQKDSTQINGTTTDKKGNFVLTGIKPGNYYSSIQFMGYLKKIINNITVSASKLNQDFGNIYLVPTTINLQNVVVEGQRAPISYQLDKKVIDVTQMQTAMSGYCCGCS